jgi:predicted NACHT family NTPase
MDQQNQNHGRDQNIINQPGTVIIQQTKLERSRSESLLLRAVADEVTSRLSQSLHNAVLINLDKQIQPEQVRNPLSAEIKIGVLPSQPLPPRTEILEVFERSDISGRLLILGDPGAGKTTTLLDLAKGLVERAREDEIAPIPIIFNLSLWKNPKQEMKDWLAEDLLSRYKSESSTDAWRRWIETGQLLPLLDGLDEVQPAHQAECVQAINRLSENRLLRLVVCSRREEYETYPTQLQLNGAICLQDLTNEQIQNYLGEVNRSELWQMLQDDAALLELIRKPLFLSITVLSYGAISLEQWQRSTSTELRLKLLFDAYWEAMITRQLVEPGLSDQGVQNQTYWKQHSGQNLSRF